MRWFRKSIVWASVGCLGLSATAHEAPAQSAAPRGISLGRPTPLHAVPDAADVRVADPVRQASFTPVSPAPSVVRAAMAETDDVAPRPLYLPKSAEALQATKVMPGPADAEQESAGATHAALPPRERVPKPKRFVTLSALQQAAYQTEPVVPTPAGQVLVGGSAYPEGTQVYDLGPVRRWYASAEYLLWWTKGYNLPPLVTTAPATVPEDIRGTLGGPGTTLLLGNERTSNGPTSGGRFTAGWYCDPCGLWAVEGSYFFLGQQDDDAFFNQDVLARPFFNINTGLQDRELTASPGNQPGDFFALNGTTTVENRSKLQGAELNLRHLRYADCDCRVNGLLGFRYLDLDEGLLIREDVTSQRAVPGFPIFDPGNFIVVSDEFATRNRFYGGQVGVDGEMRRGKWFVGGRAKVALGVTEQTINIAGSQVITTPAGGVSTFTGGLLALPSNIGSHSQTRFAVVPEVGIKLGYNLTDNVRVFVGYDFLYWSSVVRPGDQVDLAVNVRQIPNFTLNPVFAPPNPNVRPIVPFRTTDYWAHGLNAGLEVRY